MIILNMFTQSHAFQCTLHDCAKVAGMLGLKNLTLFGTTTLYSLSADIAVHDLPSYVTAKQVKVKWMED